MTTAKWARKIGARALHWIVWHTDTYLWQMPAAFVRAGIAAARIARIEGECFREYVEQLDLGPSASASDSVDALPFEDAR